MEIWYDDDTGWSEKLSRTRKVGFGKEGKRMISFIQATKIYGKSDRPALDHLNLTVEDGCLYGFLGPNGAGKTTAIRLLTGALSATEGTVQVNGIDVSRDPVAAKKQIGFVPDSQEIYDKLTGWE